MEQAQYQTEDRAEPAKKYLAENHKRGIAALIAFGFSRTEIVHTVSKRLGRKIHPTQVDYVAKRTGLDVARDSYETMQWLKNHKSARFQV